MIGWFVFVCVYEKEKENVCFAHHWHIVRCPEFNLNLSLQHHEIFNECTVADKVVVMVVMAVLGDSWSALFSSYGCLWVSSVSLRSECFTSEVTATSASLASLRDPGCPSHCGAFSLEGAQLCCSVSTRGSACNHLEAAEAGGTLGTKKTVSC